jgi:hypothetical protein
MTTTRTYVAPAHTRSVPRAPDGVVHLIGDTHFGSVPMTAIRKGVWAADLEHLNAAPATVAHIVMGDVTDHSYSAEDSEAVAFLNAHLGAGNWTAAVGNHDLHNGRTDPEVAAAAWGMPAANYVVDYPAFRLVVVAPTGIDVDDTSMIPLTADRVNWISTQCAGSGGLPAVIVCHWSLYSTVGVGESGSTQHRSTDTGFYALVDADIRAMLADTPTARAWISGHTHSPLDASGLVTTLTLGGRTFAAINASAVNYVGLPQDNTTSPVRTLYAGIDATGISVYFRDHGPGQWVAPKAMTARSTRIDF